MDRLHWNELQYVELARRAEQHAALVRSLAVARMRRPCRVALGDIERLRVCCFVCLPARYGVCQRELKGLQALRMIEQRVELRAQFMSIERRRDVRLVRIHRLALNELTSHREYRCPFVMTRLE